MTQEQKDLLLKDLCARLPYRVKGNYQNSDDVLLRKVTIMYSYLEFNGMVMTGDIKPYLFPLSNMTKAQKKEFKEISNCKDEIEDYGGFGSKGVYLIEIGKYEYDIDTTVEEFYFNYEIIDWFNKNHFDYRGLIEKGLALDATDLNIY